MAEAVNQAAFSVAEDYEKPRPRVGAVAVSPEGELLAAAHRGELIQSPPQVSPCGDHAEFVLLEFKLSDRDLSGATVFTTLEPCVSRGATSAGVPKVPCAQRLIDRGVARVVMGMLDPNPDVMGKGYARLRASGLEVGLFSGEWQRRVELQNEGFSKPYKRFLEVRASDLLHSAAYLGYTSVISVVALCKLPGANKSGEAPPGFMEGLQSFVAVVNHLDMIQSPAEEVQRDLRTRLADVGGFDEVCALTLRHLEEDRYS